MHVIASGKFRRYAHVPLWRQMFWPSVVLPNLRDLILIFAGFIQSLIKLIFWRPDVVFTKGGFVCLPVGIAARLLRIPLVIHDSDAHPGLTNRILARWANRIATGAPLEHYNYPEDISRYVGIPISHEFVPFNAEQKQAAKQEWGLDANRPLVVITGGGLGARRLNNIVLAALDNLRQVASVVLVSGVGQYDELRTKFPENNEHVQLHAFVPLVQLLGAADVAVARAGATSILELAALEKPTILVPNVRLTGGHQVKNAEVYAKNGAVKLLVEDDTYDNPQLLVEAVRGLLDTPDVASAMAKKFAKFARPAAARDMADIILEAAKR